MTDKFYRLIPNEFGRRLRTRARQSTLLKMENFLELMSFIEENLDKIEEQGWENFYEEAGDWMDYSADAVDKNLDILRPHDEKNIRRWIAGGLGFDHIEKANTWQNYSQMDSKQILDGAIDFGNENGKRMTVREMKAFALGEKTPPPPTYNFVKTLTSWITSMPRRLGWDKTKAESFAVDVRELIRKYA